MRVNLSAGQRTRSIDYKVGIKYDVFLFLFEDEDDNDPIASSTSFIIDVKLLEHVNTNEYRVPFNKLSYSEITRYENIVSNDLLPYLIVDLIDVTDERYITFINKVTNFLKVSKIRYDDIPNTEIKGFLMDIPTDIYIWLILNKNDDSYIGSVEIPSDDGTNRNYASKYVNACGSETTRHRTILLEDKSYETIINDVRLYVKSLDENFYKPNVHLHVKEDYFGGRGCIKVDLENVYVGKVRG